MDVTNIKWKKQIILVGIFLAIVFSLKIFIFTLTPFFLALIITFVIDRPVSMLSKKIPRNIAVLIMILIVLTVFVLLSIFIVTNTAYELIYLSRYLPEYREQIVEYIDKLLLRQQEMFERMPDMVTNILTRILDNIYQRGEGYLSSMIDWSLNITFYIPGYIIILLFTIIATFFISKDKRLILDYLKSKDKIAQVLDSSIINDIFSYLKVQLLILTNTTVLTGITFTILGYPYVILLAILNGILDLIPVIGPGAILWPLIIYNLFMSNIRNSIILFILYVILVSARPFLESKILGRNIGVHPLILLLGIYIGLITMGLQGIILAPLSIITFKAILNTGLEFNSTPTLNNKEKI
ncbi:MAG: sporulation integral membrane protein YtvI [Halanaerobiales bacterium]|nr:sporulation integral membrane protein YtvI [Halanaerobiales bacterium]